MLIQKVWRKWDESPVMVSFAENLTPAWQIPFPAVTICFQTKSLPRLFNLTKYFHLQLDETSRANLTEEERSLDRKERQRAAEPQHSKQSWTLDGGYPPLTPFETYPYRGTGNGGKDTLVVTLNNFLSDLDYMCTNVQGHKIFLHNPAELPSVWRHSINVPLSQEVTIAVKPKMMTTTVGLRPYSPLKRQCYFSDERYLRYFKIYTQSNCETECMVNFTHAICGCVHFGLPHGPDIKTCGAKSIRCGFSTNNTSGIFLIHVSNKIKLMQLEVKSYVDAQTIDANRFNGAHAVAARCRCLPACTSIEYEAETSQADVDLKAILKARNRTAFDKESLSLVKIYLKELQFTTMQRSELYGQVDFLANCGGLLGLFMGFSVLSVAEIIYFLTLRWWCLITKKRRNDEEICTCKHGN
ncbi:pickpocket protein 28-like [Epargyreus clarus]|uniref:pickpocket protein 28-like n=1 Tax=Epargyreus clarus TaxID=520877 RepID=UPI003C2BAB82